MELNKEKKSDLNKIDPRAIVVQQGFNVRGGYNQEEFEKLKASIRELGVLEPLLAHRDGDAVVLTSGHNRLRAVMELIEEGVSIPYVPVLLRRKGEYTEEQRILETLATNQGQPLRMHEKGEAFRRLEAHGYSKAEIARKTGTSPAEVGNALMLAKSPKKVLDLLNEEKISHVAVLAIFRTTEDEQERLQRVQEAVENAEQRTPEEPSSGGEEKKAKKATLKDVAGATGKTPISKVEEAMQVLEDLGVETSKHSHLSLVEALVGVLKNKKSTATDVAKVLMPQLFQEEEPTEETEEQEA